VPVPPTIENSCRKPADCGQRKQSIVCLELGEVQGKEFVAAGQRPKYDIELCGIGIGSLSQRHYITGKAVLFGQWTK
jgi:hypothetical protein